MTFDRGASVGYLTNLAARRMTRTLRDRVAPLGITPAQFSVLVELWQRDGLTQRELIDRLDVEQGTMGHTIQRMIRDGLLHRVAHESDARRVRLRLTPQARTLLKPAMAAATAANEEILEPLSKDEVHALLGYLRRLVEVARDPDQ